MKGAGKEKVECVGLEAKEKHRKPEKASSIIIKEQARYKDYKTLPKGYRVNPIRALLLWTTGGNERRSCSRFP
ncbi:hypothetical protein DVH24_027660 [Malus domestica]|uniref:Uncharacterized protein n=1 Tax=Malus domestica TaxID=3750 RepID=A0A498HEP2_MALDO|nr:hypothetical protein DVH24_027660 [Malus domestica]